MDQDNSGPSGLRALLFDVDGTLADTEDAHRRAFNAAFSEAGLDWTWSREQYKRLLAVTGGRERIRNFLDHDLPASARPPRLDEFIARLHRRKTDIYNRIIAQGEMPLRPGVQRLIEAARADGLRLAIATTTTAVNVRSLLKHSFAGDVDGWFEVIAAGDVVDHKKPAPDIYSYTLEKLGIPACQCLAIEDSANGLLSARGAGVLTLVTVSRYTRDDDFTSAAAVLDGLGEPDRRCHLIAGELDPAGLVDIPYLRRLHAHGWKRRPAGVRPDGIAP